MILDLESVQDDFVHDADICIVGAGAAGITLAQKFAGTGTRVCLLESGGWNFHTPTQRLYRGHLTGYDMTLDVGRYRVMGGSTTMWTGRCAKYDPIDFAERDWVAHSGWPISDADLAPYYDEAVKVCGFPGPWEDDAEALKKLRADRVSDEVVPFLWRYAPIGNRMYRNWAVEYRQVLETSDNITVITHANVTRFETPESRDHVSALQARTLDGRCVTVRAKQFVLACGGVENTRLLLATEDYIPGGLGTARDQMGRYFMQHPRGIIGRMTTSKKMSSDLQDRFNIFGTLGGTQYETGFELSEAVQRKEKILNASVIFIYDADPRSGWEAFKAFLGKSDISMSRSEAVKTMLRDPLPVARNLWRRAVQGRHANYPTRQVLLQIDLEQLPDPESRITLSDQRDKLGMRMVNVHWTMSELERRTSRVFGEYMQKAAKQTGWGEVELEPWLFEDGPIREEDLSGTYHHIATLRMADSPEHGVTDRDGKVFGVDNLYVGGCAAFSTGGHVNPTFTIITMALRMADKLKQELQA